MTKTHRQVLTRRLSDQWERLMKYHATYHFTIRYESINRDKIVQMLRRCHRLQKLINE